MDMHSRYLDEARIASGGMASVWKAYDRLLGQEVAIKRLHPHLVEDEQALARFRREVVLAASLDHRYIVTVYDSGVNDLGPFMVMELIEGETLRQRIERTGALPWFEARRIIGQITEAVGYAHARGILHRDIKPSNILLEARTGRAVITDFGIAVSSSFPDRLTSDGAAIGTIDYLAPERALGRAGTAASDVYALGAIFYEMLTGEKAFTGSTPVEIALAHQQTIPTHPSKLAQVPNAIGDVAMRSLAKDPDHRISSAEEFDLALNGAIEGTHELPTLNFSLRSIQSWWRGMTYQRKPHSGAIYAALGSLGTYLVMWAAF